MRWFFDYDNDGWLDLFVTGYTATNADIAADYLQLPQAAVRPCLFHNEQGRAFTNVTRQLGLDHAYLPMDAGFGDLDNDGYLDIYLGTGKPGYSAIMPNVMLRNLRGMQFQNVTTSGGFGHLQKGHGVCSADIDNDGDQDIYHQLGGMYPGDRFHNALFLNPGHNNHFLFIKLVGTESNRGGWGVRIMLALETPKGPRNLHRAVGCVSSFGGSPSREEIGLGDATLIRRLEVYWPTSRTKQVFADVPMDGLIQVTEGASGFERLPLKAITLD